LPPPPLLLDPTDIPTDIPSPPPWALLPTPSSAGSINSSATANSYTELHTGVGGELQTPSRPTDSSRSTESRSTDSDSGGSSGRSGSRFSPPSSPPAMQSYRLPLNMHGATDEEEAEEAERMLAPYTHATERMADDALAYTIHHTPIPIDRTVIHAAGAAGSKRGSTDAGSAMVRHCSQYRPYASVHGSHPTHRSSRSGGSNSSRSGGSNSSRSGGSNSSGSGGSNSSGSGGSNSSGSGGSNASGSGGSNSSGSGGSNASRSGGSNSSRSGGSNSSGSGGSNSSGSGGSNASLRTHTYTREEEEAAHDALASANAHMSPSAILLERAAAAATMLYSESTGTETGTGEWARSAVSVDSVVDPYNV
jgi:hypothetical protein